MIWACVEEVCRLSSNKSRLDGGRSNRKRQRKKKLKGLEDNSLAINNIHKTHK